MRTFIFLLLLLNVVYLGWNMGLLGKLTTVSSVIREPASQAGDKLQLLGEAVLSGVVLKELAVEEVVENCGPKAEELFNVVPLDSLEMQIDEKQQEKLCETIAPEL